MPIRRVAAAVMLIAPLVWLGGARFAALPDDVQTVQFGLRLPAGFEVSEFAGAGLANDIFAMTVDPRGRVVVSGRGYIRILEDDDGDGRADRAVPFADRPRDGAMGMLWEGDVLWFTGDGGLGRYRDGDGDDRADGPAELVLALKTGDEHGAHAIRRGPDGWLYVVCGNMTQIDERYATLPTSPVREPVAGCVLRVAPDRRGSEIVADGFRNAYDIDFNLDGELFTYDSDNERCVSLPWYEPTRLYHVIDGGHHGWQAPQRAAWWRMPPYFPDVVAPVAYLGRGSPTGVECYRHTAFPAQYRGGLFLADWTFGRVYYAPLVASGSSYTSEPELFIEAVGDNGFAPTDLVVHPHTGDLYISVGGRGTRGAVYRVRYRGAESSGDAPASGAGPAMLTPIAPRRLESQAGDREVLLAAARSAPPGDRLRALVAMRRHRERFEADERAAVARASWDHADRYVRQAAIALCDALEPAERKRVLGDPPQGGWPRVGWAWAMRGDDRWQAAAVAARLVDDRAADWRLRLAAVRVVQLALGGLTSKATRGTVWEGYTLRDDAITGLELTVPLVLLHCFERAYPSGRPELDRELSRTLALVGSHDPDVLSNVARQLTNESDPTDDVHHLIVLSRLMGERTAEVTRRTAAALVALDRKIAEGGRNRDRHWPLRLAELYGGLAMRDPRLNAAVLADPEFGRAGHVVFAQPPGFDRRAAAEVFARQAEAEGEFAWSGALVHLLAELPDERALPLVRRQWERVALRDAILLVLARRPRGEDRERFVEGLRSPDWNAVGHSAAALAQLPARDDGGELVALVQALGRIPDERPSRAVRDELGRTLARLTGQEFGADPRAWTQWLAEARPDLAEQLNSHGADLSAWRERLARIDWAQGDEGRGRGVFERAACAACHSQSRVGPDLAGAAARFSRDDLFVALLDPSRDVSDRYWTSVIVTDRGLVYQGAVIYEAVDGVILQTGADQTVRIAGDAIADRWVSQQSLMPVGLLDGLSDGEIADLYAYLRSLR